MADRMEGPQPPITAHQKPRFGLNPEAATRIQGELAEIDAKGPSGAPEIPIIKAFEAIDKKDQATKQELEKARQEASEAAARSEKAEQERLTDPLTGCYSRFAWEDFKKHFDLSRGNQATVIMIDLNGLKNINDEIGHLAGDQYIKDTVLYLQSIFSRSGDKVYRIGGDELAVICDFVPPEKIEEFSSYISSRFNHDLLEQKGLDFAYGAAHTDLSQDISLADAIKRADVAMYKNKNEIKAANPSKYSR